MRFLLTLLLLPATACMNIVDGGHRGVRVSAGQISDTLLEEGFYVVGPLTHIEKVSVRIRQSTTETAAASKDMQKVHAQIALNWRIEPANVITVYRNLGKAEIIEDTVIDRSISEILKAECAKMTAEEILTRRLALKVSIDAAITERLAKFGLTVDTVNLADFGFTPEFDKAVEDKQIAEQRAKQAHYEAQRATQQALAEIEKAKGQAESQRLLKESITKDLIQKLAIEKWDGHLPTWITGSGGQLPFVQLAAPGK